MWQAFSNEVSISETVQNLSEMMKETVAINFTVDHFDSEISISAVRNSFFLAV